MNFHLSFLEKLVKEAHENGKKLLLHLDLTKGLSSDEFGCEYACQILQMDGIITTKARVVETARKNKKIAVLRLFLIDSKSLEKGIALCNTIRPDYVEILPGIATSIIPYLKEHIQTEIMCGGLIKTSQQIEECIGAGACAVTISNWY